MADAQMTNNTVTTSKNSRLHFNTRQSARLQNKEDQAQKDLDGAIINKGTTCCSDSPTTMSSSLDFLASVCGFSLGIEESTRLANISLIQAKEEAVKALMDTKLKLSSDKMNRVDSDLTVQLPVQLPNESSSAQNFPLLEISENSAMMAGNLSPRDKG